jgi:hypothetical protein
MELTAEQIQSNWNKHLKIVEHYISSPRKEQVLELFKSLEDKMVLAPASGKAHFHNAIPGGYIDHVNRVVESAIKHMRLWEEMGATIDFSEEELVFSALMHDLGKIGDGEKEGYIPQTDNWRQNKLNERFLPNPELPFMLIQDRSLYILQKYGIPVSHTEYLAIRLHDGIYDDANKAYFFSSNPDSKFRTNIVYILHQADMMAAKVEYNMWQNSGRPGEFKVTKGKTATGKTVNSSEGLANLIQSL